MVCQKPFWLLKLQKPAHSVPFFYLALSCRYCAPLAHYTYMLPPSIDPSLCPLCGSANRCAMERERATGLPQPPCWCMAQKIPADVLERIPAPLRNQACVCAQCGTPLDATPAR